MRKLIFRFFNAYLKKVEIVSEIAGLKQRIINFEFDLQKLELERKRIPLNKTEFLIQAEELRTLLINNKIDCENRLKILQDKLYIYE